MTQAQRFLGFAAATVAVGLALAVLGPRLLGLAGGPEAEIVTSLKQVERAGVSLELPFGTLHSTGLQYQRLSVTLDEGGQHALVTGTLDFTGNLERPGSGHRTKVSSLGLERLDYQLRGGDWVVRGSTLERLKAVVTALEARRRALEAAPAGVSRREHRALAWYVRSERDEVQASEDWRLEEERGDRPLLQEGTTRLTLAPEADGGFAVLP